MGVQSCASNYIVCGAFGAVKPVTKPLETDKVKFGLISMLFGLFSKVFGVKESIFGVKKAKI